MIKQPRRPRTTELPAYQKIQRALLKQIESGTLNPGDPIGSERELAKRFGVSLMTSRHALSALEREGFVVRRAGAGTFVAPPRIHFNKLVSFTEHMRSRGFVARSRLLSTTTATDDEIAARLSIPPGSPIFKFDRLRFAADEPFAFETCCLSEVQFPGIQDRPFDRKSLFDVLEHDYAVKLAYADEEVDASSAEGRTAELLKVPRGAPLLRLRQILYSTAGQVIAYSIGLYRSDRHSLVIRRFR